jgi:hypothetical protein
VSGEGGGGLTIGQTVENPGEEPLGFLGKVLQVAGLGARRFGGKEVFAAGAYRYVDVSRAARHLAVSGGGRSSFPLTSEYGLAMNVGMIPYFMPTLLATSLNSTALSAMRAAVV